MTDPVKPDLKRSYKTTLHLLHWGARYGRTEKGRTAGALGGGRLGELTKPEDAQGDGTVPQPDMTTKLNMDEEEIAC